MSAPAAPSAGALAILLHGYLQQLADADPDHSLEQNDIGFSAADGPDGHWLAKAPPDTWDVDQLYTAYGIVRRYQGQLGLRGRDGRFSIEAPPGFAEMEAAARLRVAERRRLHNEQTARKIALVGGRFEVRFRYDPALVEAVRGLPGRRWNAQERCWTVPASSAAPLRAFADQHGFAYDEADFDALGRLTGEQPPAEPGATVTLDQGTLVIAFPGYDPGKVQVVKHWQGERLFRWEGASRTWRGPARARDAAEWRAVLTEWGAQLAPEVVAWLDKAESDLAAELAEEEARATARAEMIALSASLNGCPPVEGMPGLLAHQQVAPVYAERAGWRVMVGDPMGAGKTLEAMACLKAHGGLPALFIVPANVRLNWWEEIERWMPGTTVHVIAGKRPYPLPYADCYVVNYDVLGAAAGRGSKDDPLVGKPGTWCERLVELAPPALVVDESHYCMHRTTGRTKAVLAISRAIQAAHTKPLILAMTGTALPNGRAPEIVTQLDVLGRLKELGGAAAIKRQLNNGGAVELHRSLRATCYLRRPKRGPGGIFPDLEEADRRVLYPPLGSEAMAAYQRAEQDILDHLAAKAALLARETGDDPESAAVAARIRAANAEQLVRINELRRLVAVAKVPAAVSWVEKFLQVQQGKLIVFASHVEVVKTLAGRFGCPVIDGSTTGAARQAARDRFQTDPACRLVVCSIAAAAVGLTLTAAHDVLFVEQAWRPGDLAQAEARAWGRVNDLHTIRAWYLVGKNTIDEWMRTLLAAKQELIAAVEDGAVPDEDAEQARESVLGAVTAGLVAKAHGAADPIAAERDRVEQLGARVRTHLAESERLEAAVLGATPRSRT